MMLQATTVVWPTENGLIVQADGDIDVNSSPPDQDPAIWMASHLSSELSAAGWTTPGATDRLILRWLLATPSSTPVRMDKMITICQSLLTVATISPLLPLARLHRFEMVRHRYTAQSVTALSVTLQASTEAGYIRPAEPEVVLH